MFLSDQPGQEVSRDQSAGVRDERTSRREVRSSGNSGTALIGRRGFI
jgi:hypothetical protein